MFQQMKGGRNALPRQEQRTGALSQAEACSIRKGKGGRGWQITMHRDGSAVTEKFPSKAAARKRQRAIQYFKNNPGA